MDSKWGGKTESINMKLNVEQVMHTLEQYVKFCMWIVTYKHTAGMSEFHENQAKPLFVFQRTLCSQVFGY